MAIKKKKKRWKTSIDEKAEKRKLVHCWWELELVQLLWKIACRFLKKLKIASWAGKTQPAIQGNGLSFLEPWPGLSVILPRSPAIGRRCCDLKPQLAIFWKQLSRFLQLLLRSLQLSRAWNKLSVLLKLVTANSSQFRKLSWTAWWPLSCGCGFMLARSWARVASSTVMFEDQSLTCDYICFIVWVFQDRVKQTGIWAE